VKRLSLSELFVPVERPVQVIPTDTYAMVGVRSFGGGSFASGEISGSETSYPKLLRVAAGDLIYPKLMAWEGAFAFVPESLDGGYVSPEFCTFEVNEAKGDPDYLRYLFQRPDTWREVAGKSAGTNVRRRRLYPTDFLAHEISLPNLSEQKLVSAKLHEVLTRVSAATELLRRNAQLSDALPVAAAHRNDSPESERLAQGWTRVPLSEILTPASEEVMVDPSMSYPNFGILSFGRGLFEKSAIDGAQTSAKRLYRVRGGQFIYSRLFAFEGAYALVEEPFDGYFVSNEFPSFDIDVGRVHPRFLAAYFRSASTWETLAAKSKGLGVRRQRVQPAAILEHQVWLPPLDDQRRVAKTAELAIDLSRVRSKVAERLEAVRASVLNHAFAGVR
jgi:type I restriction enzyme, S subunit